MRILLLNYEYPPLGGGAGVASAALAQRLTARGHEVEVVTAAPAGASGPRSQILPNPTRDGPGPVVHGVRSRRVGIHQAGLGGAAGYLAHALPVVRQLVRRRRFELVHVFFSLPTGALLPVAGLGSMPVVLSLRGSDVPGYDPHVSALHALLHPLTRWIWRRADRVVALSEELGRLARETVPDLRFSVIHNGVDLELFHPPDGRSGADGMLRCIAVARLIERKGLDDLLAALALLERGRVRLEIVGSGPRAAYLRALADRLGVSADLCFAGALDRRQVAERYRGADLFTLAPLQEAFGNAFAEALASGLPIVGSCVGGIPEFVRDGENGILVPPRDPAALAAAIRRFADSPSLRAETSRRNRLRAQAELSWDFATERYLDVYREARSRGRASNPSGPAPARARPSA